MYAFISNEFKSILHTQRQLDLFLSIYSYPKFIKVNSKEEAYEFFRKNDREYFSAGINKYGCKDSTVGYVSISYFIANNNIYFNINTSKFGYIKLSKYPANVDKSEQYDLIKVKVKDVVLDDSMIAHHCIAIQWVLRLLGPYCNIELILPDISIYLALEKYTGTDSQIKRAQAMIRNRYAQTFYTVK